MAPSAMEARLERLRAVIKNDLDKLPDLPPKAEPLPEVKLAAKPNIKAQSKPEVKSQPKPAPKPNIGSILWPDAQPDSDSDDSEADCEIEFIRIDEEERVKELEEEDSSDENGSTIVSTMGKGMSPGQLTPVGQSFAAILAFSKFPYRYIPKGESEKVADRFFNGGKFFMREWDLYYVWPLDYSDKPLVLIPEDQFVQLIKEINTQFPRLYVNSKDPYYREIGLTINFNFKHPRFRPRYLGRCKSRDQYDNMVNRAPDATFTRKDDPTPNSVSDDRSKETFRVMVENSIATNKAKNKGNKEMRRVARVEKQKDMGKQLKRAQHYLGVRPKKEKIEEQAATAAREEALAIPPIEHNEPVPYPFESSPIFVCIDVEAYERSSKIITEIGVATLDTLDLVGVAPGVSGKNWQQKIRARHFRIKEHKSYRNGEFVSDAADQFEFGESEFIALEDAPAIIASCFKHPFSKPEEEEEDAGHGLKVNEGSLEEPKRNIIFVAHDVNSDIQFLRQVGYDPLNLSNLIETLDTALLYRAHKRDPNAKAVGNILCDFDFVGWNLHNAGNDAVYTMWILLATCVGEATGRGKKETEEEERKARWEEDIKASEKRAKEMVLEDHAE